MQESPPAAGFTRVVRWPSTRTPRSKGVVQGTNGTLLGRPAGEASPYVLVGLMRCGLCAGSMEVVSRKSGARRAFAYRCYRSRRQGTSVCSNRVPISMTTADDAVLGAVEKTLLNPAVVERALSLAEADILDGGSARRRAPLVADLAALDADVDRLTTAIKRGGELDPLLASLRESEARRTPSADSGNRRRAPPNDARRERGPREAPELRRGLPEATPRACAADAADPPATHRREADVYSQAEWRLRVRRTRNSAAATRWGDM